MLYCEQSVSKVLDDPIAPDTAFIDKEIPQYTRYSTANSKPANLPVRQPFLPPFTVDRQTSYEQGVVTCNV